VSTLIAQQLDDHVDVKTHPTIVSTLISRSWSLNDVQTTTAHNLHLAQTSTPTSFPSTLPFLHCQFAMAIPCDKTVHCSPAVQTRLGLREANCAIPRFGDRTASGAEHCDQIKQNSNMTGFNTQQAAHLFNNLNDASKNNPSSPENAATVVRLARLGGQPIPEQCSRIAGNLGLETVTFCNAPGGPIFVGRTDGEKLISFVHLNQDEGPNCTKWCDMTGREQWEWCTAWMASGKSHLRDENRTRGLKGTDPAARINNPAELTQALHNSPSLALRTPTRPQGNTIPAAAWNRATETTRQLFQRKHWN